MKVVTICGSMRFQKEMIKIAQKLELEQNYCVLQCVYDLPPVTTAQLQKLSALHYKKIDISDAIYVVNINGYVGESCQNEIEYAKSLNKEIIYHEKIKNTGKTK